MENLDLGVPQISVIIGNHPALYRNSERKTLIAAEKS
jgi:hypothetical protein